jgi:hypothetical protein
MENTGMNYRKSSYSGNGGGNCVEVGSADGVMVRDTTDREGGTLAFSADAWERFLAKLQ